MQVVSNMLGPNSGVGYPPPSHTTTKKNVHINIYMRDQFSSYSPHVRLTSVLQIFVCEDT